MPQHQGGDVVPAGQFDLRASFYGIKRSYELPQRHEQRTHMSGQHRAHLHVGHVSAFALMKTHQHRTLFVHMAHRKTGAVTVAPSRALYGSQNMVGLDFAQMPQVVFQYPLLDRHLRGRLQVLHLAATTGPSMQTKMGATGLHALRRGLVDVA